MRFNPSRAPHFTMAVAVAAAAFIAAPVHAQAVRTLTACTSDAFAACAELRLTSGPSLFELGVRNLGLVGAPEPASAIYNLVFATGSAEAAAPVASYVSPGVIGGAIVSDNADWEIFDTGDLLFVSALSNRGVGGCVEGSDVGGFGQAVRTCGDGEFANFQFAPIFGFDVTQFELLSLEFAVLTDPLGAASCGFDACDIVADETTLPPTPVPEPTSAALLAAGLLVLAGMGCRAPRKTVGV